MSDSLHNSASDATPERQVAERDAPSVAPDAEVPPRPATPPEEPDLATTALADLARTAETTWKSARRWVIFVVGVSIVLFGLIVGILPGVPGIPIMFLGFALLATEFIWARKILKRLKQEALALKAKAERAMGLTPSTPPTTPSDDAPGEGQTPSPGGDAAHTHPTHPSPDPRDQRGAA